jgi:NAD(P)-dependent dehydrogenase (short-subunit alcohol dehydrogenase family)
MLLKDKVAVVTGGTSGIGRAIVELFAREGAFVVFSGRRRELGEEIARANGARYVEADVAREADAERTVSEATQLGQGLDILVNNAGMGSKTGRIEKTSLESFDQMIAVHLRGALAHMKYAVPPMRARGGGSIVNVASVGGLRAGFGSLAYSAAKAGLIHLSRCAAVELAEARIRVNSLSPGGIATGIFGKAMGVGSEKAEAGVEDLVAGMAGFQPLPRAGLAEDVAQAALFLASDQSSFVTGTDLVIDGALIAGRRPSEAAAASAPLRTIYG